MNKNVELDEIIKDENITVLDTTCPECGSISLMTNDGDCYIGIDDSTEMTSEELLVHKAHEVGHCVNGAFYNKYAKFDVVSKHEHTADKWAIKMLIPEDELIEMCEKGLTETWELADYFDVTEEFMIKACEFYGYYHRAI